MGLLIRYLLINILVLFTPLFCIQYTEQSIEKIKVFTYNNVQDQILFEALDYFNVPYQKIDKIEKNDQQLYVICNIESLTEEQLPKYFIVFQTQNLDQRGLTEQDFQKLSKAVVVWDYDLSNVNKYSSRIIQHMPPWHEAAKADPAILPLFLPVQALDTYREILKYSIIHDSDINQHLPTIYCHTLMSNPKLIMELGVRGGESTKALFGAAKITNGKLIGLDIDLSCIDIYKRLHAPDMVQFLCQNDIDFGIKNRDFYNQQVDVLFIDTSHEYIQTLKEITIYLPFLNQNGIMLFHDSNWNSRLSGVTRALKRHFGDFDETQYIFKVFNYKGHKWKMIHYPNKNGLMVLKKL